MQVGIHARWTLKGECLGIRVDGATVVTNHVDLHDEFGTRKRVPVGYYLRKIARAVGHLALGRFSRPRRFCPKQAVLPGGIPYHHRKSHNAKSERPLLKIFPQSSLG